MKRKLNSDIFLVQCVFLLAITGISILLYTIFMPVYYEYVKDKQIIQAYSDIGEIDLAELEEKDYVMFANYENENLSFYIADEDMNPVYVTKNSDSEKHAITRNIVRKLDAFSRKPEIIRSSGKLLETAKYRGIMNQSEKDYYIVIKDIAAGRKSITMAEIFYLSMFVLMMIPGSIFMIFFWKQRLKSLEQLISVSEQITDGNFSVQVQEKGRYEEFNQLSACINEMSRRLQEQTGRLEENKKQMLHHNVRQDQMEKRRKDLIANISHELKTPLTILKGQLENMILGFGDYQNHDKYLPQVLKSAEDIEYLVKEILSITKMETMNIGSSLETLSLADMISKVVTELQPLAAEKDIAILQNIPEDISVSVNRNLFAKALSNIIGNAIRHSKDGAKVYADFDRDTHILVVENTGVFLDEDNL